MSEGDKKDDVTQVGGAAPAVPKLPSVPPPRPAPASDERPAGDATHVGGAAPKLPKPGAQASPPPQPTPTPTPPATADDEGEETVAIGQVAQRAPYSLQRIQPAGHTGVVYLTSDTYLLGRKHGADLPLFSPSASREHARLVRRADGWYLETLPEKIVIANGAVVGTAVRLEHKMRLQIGGDELIFFDETTLTSRAAAPAASAPAGRSRRWIGLFLALAALIAAAVVAVWWEHW